MWVEVVYPNRFICSTLSAQVRCLLSSFPVFARHCFCRGHTLPYCSIFFSFSVATNCIASPLTRTRKKRDTFPHHTPLPSPSRLIPSLSFLVAAFGTHPFVLTFFFSDNSASFSLHNKQTKHIKIFLFSSLHHLINHSYHKPFITFFYSPTPTHSFLSFHSLFFLLSSFAHTSHLLFTYFQLTQETEYGLSIILVHSSPALH